jgi:sec-independent protein translocase protein TatA
MFGISIEHILIVGIILIIVGPRRLPELGNTMGKAIKNFKDSFSGIEEASFKRIMTPDEKLSATQATTTTPAQAATVTPAEAATTVSASTISAATISPLTPVTISPSANSDEAASLASVVKPSINA